MAKKIVKKKKLKIFNLLIILTVLGVISFGVYLALESPIRNINVSGNSYLNDDYILSTAGIIDYPGFLAISDFSIVKTIKKSPYITNVIIKKYFFYVIDLKIVEYTPIFYNNSKKNVVFSDKREVPISECSYIFRVPRLINYVPDNKYNSFIKHMNSINPEILGKISDIEYLPNGFDKDRFLLYMDDDNMVYLTLSKFKNINLYNDVLEQLDNRKGILYLDSGNHFQVKE